MTERYDREEIEASGARTLAQFLMIATPLVAITNMGHNRPGSNAPLLSTGGTGTQFGHEHIAFFVDGRRLDSSYRFGPDLTQIPLIAIESVTLHQGSGVATYGQGGSAAVVAIETRQGKGVLLRGALGQESASQIQVLAGSRSDVLDYTLQAGRERQKPLYETNRSRPQQIHEQAMGRLVFRPTDALEFRLSMDGSFSREHKPGHLSSDSFKEDAEQFSGHEAQVQQRIGAKGIEAIYRLSDSLTLQGHLYETRLNPRHTDATGNEENAVKTVDQSRLSLIWQPLKQAKLQAGYDRYRFHRFQSLESGERDENIWWRSPWLRVDLKGGGHHLYGGYRQSKTRYLYELDYFEGQAPAESPEYIREGTRHEPKAHELGYSWQPLKGPVTLFGTLQEGYDGYSAHVHRARFSENSLLVIDPKLSSSRQERIGVRYQDEHLFASLARFENRWKNRRYEPMAVTLDPQLDEVEASGLEARLHLSLPHFQLWLNRQQSEAKTTREANTPTAEGEKIPGLYTTRTGATVRFSWPGGYLQLAGYQMQDALPQSRYQGDHTHEPEDLEWMNLTIAHHLYGAKLSLLVENLQDTPQGFWAGDNRVYSFDPGRRIFLAAEYNF